MASVSKSHHEHLNYKGIKKVKIKSINKKQAWPNSKRSARKDSDDKMDTQVSSSSLDPPESSAKKVSSANFVAGLLPVITTQQSSSGEPVTQLTFSIQSAPSSSRGNIMTSSSSTMPVKTNGKTPVCLVCSDESSGYHYGVDSCEGCKGFFRRCITQGMTHKCSNEEKCEITPFTRNSCQYCRLKKCFAVGMSREASRLGRRPKRLKDSSGEPKRDNLPIAPYPSPAELYKLRMAELQRLLQQNGTFKSELMQAFLNAAQHSFREHQRNNNDNQNNRKDNKKPNNNKKSGGTESGHSSGSSPSISASSLSPQSDISNKNVNNTTDTKTGIIDENVDNLRIAQEANTLDNSRTSPQTTDFSNLTEIKNEPGLDNVFTMTDNSNSNFGGMPPMTDAASPFIMPDLSPDTMMMMPDMMGMMDDNSMMQSMMSGMMGGMDPAAMMGGMDPASMMAGMDPASMMGGMDPSNLMCSEPDDNANEIDVDRIMEEVRQVPSSLRQQLINQVITMVSEAHLLTVTPTREKVAQANDRIDKMRMESGMPDLSKLSINPGHMWQKFVQSMVYEITQVVKFCKKLPGFGEIQQEDQIVLIKKGSFELLLCRMCLLVDDVNQEMFDPNMEMKCPRALIKQMPMGPFIDEFFNVASQLNPLKLTDEEVGIFSASLIMCPDRDGLQNIKAVEKLHMLFLQSLYLEMREKHQNYEDKFARLLSLIPVFRNVNLKHSKALNSMKMQKAPVINEFPELHKEIYDVKDED